MGATEISSYRISPEKLISVSHKPVVRRINTNQILNQTNFTPKLYRIWYTDDFGWLVSKSTVPKTVYSFCDTPL